MVINTEFDIGQKVWAVYARWTRRERTVCDKCGGLGYIRRFHEDDEGIQCYECGGECSFSNDTLDHFVEEVVITFILVHISEGRQTETYLSAGERGGTETLWHVCTSKKAAQKWLEKRLEQEKEWKDQYKEPGDNANVQEL